MRILRTLVFSCFVIGAFLLIFFFGCHKREALFSEHSNGKRPKPTTPGNKIIGNTIKIGLISSITGQLESMGVEAAIGGQIAADEINKLGGIKGRKIELLIADSGSKPEGGKSAAEKLISEGAVALIGDISSGITAQIAKSAYDAGVPLVSVAATRTDLTDIGSNVFRVCYTDDIQAAVMAIFARDQLNIKRMAIMTDKKQPYSIGLSGNFRDIFIKLGGKIVDEQFFESGQTQFQSILTNLTVTAPEGVFISGYYPEVGPMARQMDQMGLDIYKLGGDGWDSSELVMGGGQAILGSYYCLAYSFNEKRPEVQNFLKKWLKKQNAKPATTTGALSYDAVYLVADAISRAKNLDDSSIIESIDDTINFAGVTSTITFRGRQGNPAKRLLVVEVQQKSPLPVKVYEYDQIQKILGNIGFKY